MKCKKCGFENKLGIKKCENCGKKLKKSHPFLVTLLVLFILGIIYLGTINVLGYLRNEKLPVYSPMFLFEKVDYEKIEEKVKDAGEKYINQRAYKDEEFEDNSNITIKDLIKKNYLEKEDVNYCDGYALVSTSKDVDSYIKCKKYKTTGYKNKYSKTTNIKIKKVQISREVTKIDDYNYSLDLDNLRLNDSLEIQVDKKFKLNFKKTKTEDQLYTFDLYVNNKKQTEEYIGITGSYDFGKFEVSIIDNYLFYEDTHRTDKHQLNLYAVTKDGTSTLITDTLDEDKDMYPDKFEVKDGVLTITSSRSYHGPSIIYKEKYYGVCREEETGVGLASSLDQDLPVEKLYTLEVKDGKLELVETKTTQTLSKFLEESNEYCSN